MKLKSILLCGAFILISTSNINAQSFSTISAGANEKLFYEVIDSNNKKVALTSNTKDKNAKYKGTITIPESVNFLGEIYKVTAIKEKAFSNCDSLQKVYLPASLDTIAKDAFINCVNLSNIFFSSKQVNIDKNAFRGCDSIKDISIGNDWFNIDFSPFADSKVLNTIYIPAKVKKINNIKSLKSLIFINVDGNNPYYSSKNGILLNKDATELLFCPSGKNGNLKIPEGIKRIKKGALVITKGLTQIDFPCSLNSLYFRELYRLINLKRVIFRSEQGLKTAVKDNKQLFVLEIDVDKDFQIIVPSVAKKIYSNICSEEGYYKEITSEKSEPVLVLERKMAKAKMVKGVKNISKYE